MAQTEEKKGIHETEKKILQAAEEEFMHKGFAGARTTSIAKAAGVTHAMLHYYFRTKEKLYERIISEKIDMLRDMIADSFTDIDKPLEELLHNLINVHLDFISANPYIPRFVLDEVYSNPESKDTFIGKLKEVAPAVLSKLQMKIDDKASKGECRRVDAMMLMLDIVSLNIFPYVAAPIVNAVLDNCMEDKSGFLELRKRENVDTIMRKLKP